LLWLGVFSEHAEQTLACLARAQIKFECAWQLRGINLCVLVKNAKYSQKSAKMLGENLNNSDNIDHVFARFATKFAVCLFFLKFIGSLAFFNIYMQQNRHFSGDLTKMGPRNKT